MSPRKRTRHRSQEPRAWVPYAIVAAVPTVVYPVFFALVHGRWPW